ncbi:MAG TPA: hypothetical protein VFL16_18080 [Steroidobacteraceae bacterium]|nr:hypothetical protein [Steroidobacteraceae bacterium]
MPDIDDLKALRAWLGSHRELRPGQLNEREVATLVVCAGRAAGFIVRTEIKVPTCLPDGGIVNGEMDVGWFHAQSNKLIAAWELDGQDVPDAHLLGSVTKGKAGNKAKFDACGAPLRIQVLYSVKNNLEPKRPSKKSIVERLLGTSATVVSDEDLMAEPGILYWIRRAESLAPPPATRGEAA